MTNPYNPNNSPEDRNEHTGGMPSYGDYTGQGGLPQYPNQDFGYGQQAYDPNSLVPSNAYPGAGRRLGAFLLDGLLFFLVAVVLAAIFIAPGFMSWMDDYSAWLDAGQVGVEPELDLGNFYLYSLLSLVLWFAYRVGMETTAGRTLGKMALGIKVVDADGRVISAKDSFIRNSWYLAGIVVGWIPFIGNIASIAIYAALGVLIARDPHRQHICDKWAKSYVVYNR
ncbi:MULTISPECIES: RDD family protein [unclassified Corynebacterium]|uniref:RDD family protein n=1 Tax=unclassified Corynebacterium TaxID=2624378 RepID=UPI002647D1B9|nr:RDD family protein [Corynebacterium sp.]MDN5581258.1 RDD family protein [Corynebacterium sp.]MDN6258226.1 RDD family protein [Corynebacterium sp.]MDN6326213.1 RDD family protein [Corynebacterium sp.]MDN6377209.1 RDD family protein [Corynebacterium sp.]